MERCRVCKKTAVYLAILHDGARVPYCRKHLPRWNVDPEKLAYQRLMALLRRLWGS